MCLPGGNGLTNQCWSLEISWDHKRAVDICPKNIHPARTKNRFRSNLATKNASMDPLQDGHQIFVLSEFPRCLLLLARFPFVFGLIKMKTKNVLNQTITE